MANRERRRCRKCSDKVKAPEVTGNIKWIIPRGAPPGARPRPVVIRHKSLPSAPSQESSVDLESS